MQRKKYTQDVIKNYLIIYISFIDFLMLKRILSISSVGEDFFIFNVNSNTIRFI